jgi:hypothetical protein
MARRTTRPAGPFSDPVRGPSAFLLGTLLSLVEQGQYIFDNGLGPSLWEGEGHHSWAREQGEAFPQVMLWELRAHAATLESLLYFDELRARGSRRGAGPWP